MRNRLWKFWWVPIIPAVVLIDRTGVLPALPGDPADLQLRVWLAFAVLLSLYMAVLRGRVQHLERDRGETSDRVWLPDRMSRQWFVAAPLWAVVSPGSVASFAVLLWLAFLAHEFLVPVVGWEPLREVGSRFRPALASSSE